MPAPGRALRRAVNPISTGLTRWWCKIGPLRQVPARPAVWDVGRYPRPASFVGATSPGEWIVPAGRRPGWDWLPEHGAAPNLAAMPRWVRAWYRTPWLDRYAYEWMWWHGGWSVLVPSPPPDPPDGGVHEPRRPLPPDQGSGATLTHEPGAATPRSTQTSDSGD